jgi:transposase
MAGTRRSRRERGKSDQIEAVSVARAALAAGIETLPTAALAGPELAIRLLVDHRERLVRTRVALNSTLQWNLHDLWPELTLPGGALFSKKWTTKERPAPPHAHAPGARRGGRARAAKRGAPRDVHPANITPPDPAGPRCTRRDGRTG